MLRAFRQTKWIVAAFVVVALAAVFIRLGLWQLDRLEERRATNAIGVERLSEEPVRLAQVLEEAGGDVESVQYRLVFLSGTYDPSEEVLIRSQVELGQAGFHVITPLVEDDGSTVLVNRGWVPLSMDTPPVGPRPPSGRQVVEGWVQLSQSRPAFGPEDRSGQEQVFNRVDIGLIGEQMSHDLASVYVVAMGERGEQLPITVDAPDFTNEGPHLAYAIQWFGFAAVGLIGFYFLIRRKGGQSR